MDADLHLTLDPDKPHDKVFRAVFGKPEVAADFLSRQLPESLAKAIDWDSLTPVSETLLDASMSERFTDILLRARWRENPDRETCLFLLFEHQSTRDPWMALRLLSGILRLWEKERSRCSGSDRLPAVIPLVFFQGPGGWGPSRRMIDLVAVSQTAQEVVKGIPDFEYTVIELLGRDVAEAAEQTLTRATLAIMQATRGGWASEEDRERLVTWLRSLLAEPQTMQLARLLMTYWVAASDELDGPTICDTLKRCFPKESEVMTYAQSLIRQGREEGREEGREKGREEGWKQGEAHGRQEGRVEAEHGAVLRLAAFRFGTETAQARKEAIRCLTVSQLNALFDRLLVGLDSVAALDAWLARPEGGQG